MTVVTLNQVLRSNFSAFLHHPQLLSNLAQSANDLLIPACKSKYHVRNSDVVAELLYILLRPAQIMSRETREQMVHNLVIETAMYKVQPRRAIDVHRRPHHFLSK